MSRLGVVTLLLLLLFSSVSVQAEHLSRQSPTPTGLTVSGTTSTTISLTWSAPASDIVAYSIYRCEGPPCTPGWEAEVNQNGQDIAPAPTEYVDTDVTSGTTYRYQVASNDAMYIESHRSGGVTARSGGVTKTAGTPPPPIVLKVTGLKATAASADSISLSWKPTVRDVMTTYSVYRCTVPQGETTCDPYDGLWLAALRNSNVYTDTEVAPGETYRYAVAVEPFRREELSGAITVVAQMPQMLATPTGLMVTETDESSVRLRWTTPEDDGRGPVESIDIYRCNVDRSPDCSEFLYLTSRNPALTEYKDNDVESDTTYRYAVAAYRSDDEVSPWSNQVTATAEGEPEPKPESPATEVPAPTDLTVTAVDESGISLSWTAPEGVDVRGYNVLRCEEGETPCTLGWFDWVTAGAGDPPPAPTEYTDTEVTAGTTYRYTVEAQAGDDYDTSPWSNQVTAAPEGEPEPEPEPEPPAPEVPAPTDLTVTAVDESGISLSWTAPEGVDLRGYNVLRCEEGETPCTPEWLARVTAGAGDPPPAPTEYTDTEVTAGTTYRYTVEAQAGDDYDTSPWSNQVTAAPEGEPEPEPEPPAPEVPAPTDLTVTAVDESGISLSWTAPEGVDLRGYNVLRCEEGETPCTPEWLARVTAGDGDPPPAPTEYTDTEVTAGTTYRYTVEAQAGDDYDTSPWSNQVTAAPECEPEPEPEPPAPEVPAPTDLTVTAVDESGISLSWTAPEGVDLRSYNVLRCEEGETPCTPEWLARVTAGAGDPPPAPTEYTDTEVTAGTTYRYTVEAQAGDDYDTSPWSNQVTAAPEGEPEPEPEPPAPEVPAPTDLTVTAVDESGISLSWTAPEGVDLRGYNVLRCEEGETPCTPEWLARVTAGDGDPPPAPTEYTDTEVTAGTTYRYTVEAQAGDDYDTSPWSNQVTAAPECEPEPEPEPPAPEVPAPTDLTVTAVDESGISLSWTAPEGVDLRGYNVLRCEEGETPCTPEWLARVTAGAGDPPPAPTEYTDTEVTAGTTYRYTVEAQAGDDYDTSPFSNQVTAQAGEPDTGGPGPEERALTLESGMAALGRTMAGQAVDTFGGRFASLSTSVDTQSASANRRLDSFTGALKLAAEQMGIPMAVADVDDVLHAGPEWGPWMSDADLLTEACSATVSGCPEDTEGNLILGNLTLRQLLSQNSFQLALGESDDSGASAWTLWGRGNVSGFEGQSANELALDGEVVSGYLGLDYRWGTDTLLGVAVSHSQGDIDYEETETGAGELETTMRSVYPYAYWSPRPGLGLWGVLGYGSGETALTDTAVSNLETDVEMWMAALGGRSELFTLGRVDMAVKADAFSVWMESDTLEALESTRVDSGRLRLALEGRTSLTLSEHSRLTPSLELGTRWDSGDAETGLGAELGGALAYTNTRLGLSMEASGRYLLTHEEESFEEWGASLSACVSAGGDGTGLALTLKPVWGNAASGVDALWGADGRTRVEGMGLATPRSASWQPDRLDLGLRYGSDTPHGLLSPFGEVGLQGSDTYSMRLGTQLDTATGWKLDFFGGHVSRQVGTADNLVGLTASYGFGAAGMSQAFAGTMPATSNWSTCNKRPAL